jgi:hypothetical protein
MPLYIYNKRISTDSYGDYMIEIRPKGVYADISGGVKHLGAPFGAVSWKSRDWDFISPEEKERRSTLLQLLKDRISSSKRRSS